MLSLETTADPSRKLLGRDRLTATPETGNVFGLTQGLEVSEKKGGAPPASPLSAFETQGAIGLEGAREKQRQLALRRVHRYPSSSHALNAAAQTLLSIGDKEEALGFLRKALELDPSNQVVRLNLARALTSSGDLACAEELYRELSKTTGATGAQALKNLAQLLIRTNRFTEAEALLSTILGGDGQDSGAYNQRGVTRLAQRKIGEAIRDFRSAIRLETRFTAAHNNLGVAFLLSGSLSRALLSFRAALKLNPAYGDAALNFAGVAERVGKAEESIEVLENYLSLKGKDMRATEELARLHIGTGHPERGLRLLDTLIAASDFGANPNEAARLANNIGAAYLLLRRGDSALEWFRRSIALGPNDCTPYCNLAEVLLGRGREEEANTILTEALVRYSNDTRAQQLLASYYMRRDLPEAAVACLRRALDLNPHDWLTNAWLGSIMSDAFGQHDEAVKILRDGIKAASEVDLLKNNLAYVLLMKGSIGEARQVLESVMQPTARDLVFLNATRGLLALREGHVQEGQRLYNEAARLAFNEDTRNLVLQKKAVEVARVYTEQGDYRRAADLLTEARKIGPTSHKLFLKQAHGLQQALTEGESAGDSGDQ